MAMYTSFNARAVGRNFSARETIEHAAAAGFGGVDLLVRDLVEAGDDPKSLRRRMDELGVRGGAWPLPVDWRGEADRFARDLERLPGLAEAATILGLTRTGTWVLPETPERPATEAGRAAHFEATVAFHRERLGAIARTLAGFGHRLGLEVIGVASSRSGRGMPFVTSLADLGRVFGALWAELPNLGILLDGFHLYAAGETIEAGLAWGVNRVVWVHVADLPASATSDRAAILDHQRGLPGENGTIDSRSLLRRLAKAGYDGPVTAEPMGGCASLGGLSNEATVRNVAAALHSVWPDDAG